ncbi:TFIIB-type zinc ribbon-containing protein [Lysinibacillus sp. CTST325]
MIEKYVITCPYCGSVLKPEGEKYYCDFCIMILPADRVQRNHERVSVRVRDFALDVYLDKTTPELMRYSTYELLSLLKYARAERTNIYKLMNTFYNARKQQGIEEYKESEEYSGKEYEKITRKMFVLENLIRQRLGYVPHRITDVYLGKYLAAMEKDKRQPMIIRQQRKDDIKTN